MTRNTVTLADEKPLLLGDHAYEMIRRDIINCELVPGSEATEAALAGRLGLGKAPVRFALARLCQEGLVRPLPRRGYVVAPITIKDVHEILEMRMALEPVAARLAVGRLDLAELRSLTASAAKTREHDAVDHEVNRAFHNAIAQASGNSRMAGTLTDLLDQMERFVRLFIKNRDVKHAEQDHRTLKIEHARILDAFAATDANAAEEAVRNHLQTTYRLIMDAIVKGRPEGVRIPG
ncbi:MAG: GntR family transcriptional regulator [Rhodospirillales bacterium]